MIRVTRLNKEEFLVNGELIEFVEETPHTVISMTSGRRLVVAETSEQVRQLVIDYKRLLLREGPFERHES
ncbi:MAG: flagellar FlbD family protein [Clostridiales bacterium]|jgi:flagellar protein FlbD|nr:flagellar FlbD family protein [Clostridiales bacterium]